jgi:cytochrome P450
MKNEIAMDAGIAAPAPDFVSPAGEAARRRPPGPPAVPGLDWIGNVLPVLRDPVVRLLELQQKYGDIIAMGKRKSAPIVVFSPEYNHQILSQPEVFYNLDVNSPDAPIQMPQNTAASRLLSGVAGMNGPKHIQHRRMLMPAFHKKRVEALVDMVVSRTQRCIAPWRPGQQIDLVHEMVELSLDFAITGLIGLDAGEEGHRIHELLQRWGKHGLSAQVQLLPFDLPGLPYRRFLRLSEELEVEFRKVIARKRAGGIDDADALSLLLEVQDEDGTTLTETELLGHLTTLFTAGHETTASAMTWTLLLLSQHPDVMRGVMEEIDQRLGGRVPCMEDLREMPRMERAIRESLRMFPPGIWMLRTAVEPFQLGPYRFPRGTQVVFSPGVTHRRPDLYAEPNRYIPDRWEIIERNTYEYLPFGGGPRRCLGATFAQMELQVALPVILQRFRLEIADGTRVDRSGTILSFPRGQLPVTLREQDHLFPKARVVGNIHQLVEL